MGSPITAAVAAARFPFERTYAEALPDLVVEHRPTPVPDPELVVVNEQLADEIGLDVAALGSAPGTAVLAGASVVEGCAPVAMAYSGHQFGGFSPVLGDGRAVLLGEIVDPHGRRLDVHLKGSGRTPFARGGDGKATIGPMLREYLIGEAMAALGIPTTRALAVCSTGESVRRNRPEPGAVLARVAASHIRVGTFQYAARLPDSGVLRDLARYAIERHHRQAASADNPYLALLDAVIGVQADLVARWMHVGFIHGVMNTDNVAISGEGIDYGPCAFMDRYDPATVYSSIDHGGRYAYANQPRIALWNLARFAETLLPLIDADPDAAVAAATAVLETFEHRYQRVWNAGMAVKLGFDIDDLDDDEALIGDWLGLLHHHRVDYTSSFRALAASLRGDRETIEEWFDDSDGPDGFAEWEQRWRRRLGDAGREQVADRMDSVNPVFIPRNHLVEAALDAATNGDMEPFEALLAVLTRPFDDRADLTAYRGPAPAEFDDTYQTFCGT